MATRKDIIFGLLTLAAVVVTLQIIFNFQKEKENSACLSRCNTTYQPVKNIQMATLISKWKACVLECE